MTFTKLTAGFVVLSLLSSCSLSAKPSQISIQDRQETASNLDTKVVKAANGFGLQIHKQLALQDPDVNIFLSPLSISMALGMAYNGSSGTTKEQMASALGWKGMSDEEINRGNQTLNTLLQKSGKGVEVHMANSMWLRKDFSFNKKFLDTNKTYYGAKAEELDFNDSDKTVQTINKWVDEQTKAKIPNLLKQVDPSDVMFLVNAVYFKGAWTQEFRTADTKDDLFKKKNGSSKTVKMMSQQGSYEYVKAEDYEAVRLPYGEGQMDLLVVLPDEQSTLQALQEKIWQDPSQFQKPFKKSSGQIRIPRFKAEYGKSLIESLKKMGMNIPFDPLQADLSRIAATPPNLFIGKVTHKSYIEVNEKGTEAAAATVVGVKTTSLEQPQDPFDLKVDRPFFIAIEDRQTGAWLFVGSIVEP
ncbi:serpin family protein [Paenibacillus lutrae]|uniref:serpin family protein n=1 Tax=Paenibacillus lutrae TaxID=2078573 RepID=UPI0012FC0FAC|nr:serpin family protein [Paenibacillus lutrae]